MKILLKDLSAVQDSLVRMLRKEIDVKLAYRMHKISGKIVSELKQVQNEIAELNKKYGEDEKIEGKATGRSLIPEKSRKAFEKDVEALLSVEVDLGTELIPFECLEDMGKISPLDFANIEKFVAPPTPTKGGKK